MTFIDSHSLPRLLDLANQEKDIKRQDFFTLVNNVGNNPAARGIVFDWARENYQTFVDRFVSLLVCLAI